MHRRIIDFVFFCSCSALRLQTRGKVDDSENEICGLSALLTGKEQIETSLAAEHCKDYKPKFETKDFHSSQGRKNILWVHLHNFGGTFMCQEARSQRESTGQNNCNIKGDGCSQETNLLGCGQRGKYSFSAIERSVKDGDFNCSDTLYGVMLRDPIAGMRSTMVQDAFGKQKNDIIEALRNKRAVNNFANPGHSGHSCLPFGDNYQHFDNFMTRSLSGNYNSPPGQVSSKDFEEAKARLRQMNVILIMEEMNYHLPQLRSTFKWDIPNSDTLKKANSHPNRLIEQAFTPDEEKFLRNTDMSFDYELYEYGKQLAKQLTAATEKP